MRLRRPALIAAVAAVALLVTSSTASADAPVATYEVTVTDLTGGQPLTPPVVATHRAATEVFTVGRPASFELKEIAENGNLAPMLAALDSDKHVADVAAAATPLVPAGLPGSAMFSNSVTLTVSASEGAKFLSFASMLICTNDGFTGVDSSPAETRGRHRCRPVRGLRRRHRAKHRGLRRHRSHPPAAPISSPRSTAGRTPLPRSASNGSAETMCGWAGC
jgi:Spondin_N